MVSLLDYIEASIGDFWESRKLTTKAFKPFVVERFHRSIHCIPQLMFLPLNIPTGTAEQPFEEGEWIHAWSHKATHTIIAVIMGAENKPRVHFFKMPLESSSWVRTDIDLEANYSKVFNTPDEARDYVNATLLDDTFIDWFIAETYETNKETTEALTLHRGITTEHLEHAYSASKPVLVKPAGETDA